MTPGAAECPAPGSGLVWGIVTARLVAGTVAVRGSTVSKDIDLAGQIIVERAGIGTTAVVRSCGEADFQITVPCCGGVVKCGVVRVTLLAVITAGIILVMLGMASGSTSEVGYGCT